MQLKINKEIFVELLSSVCSVVERKHTLNILSNVKILITEDEISLYGSDLEVELIASAPLNKGECIKPGGATVPARKLLDICKALPNQAVINMEILNDERCIVKSKQSKFALGTLPHEDFPLLNSKGSNQQPSKSNQIEISSSELKRLFEKTAFSMAAQDVRFYLTGTLLEIDKEALRVVTTDGHRLSLCESKAKTNVEHVTQAILPKKAISELQRLINGKDETLKLSITNELAQVELNLSSKDTPQYKIQFTTKLIDGKFPDYNRIIPRDNDKIATIDHNELKQTLHRVAILSNEKIRGIIFNFTENSLELRARNAEQEEAVEDIAIEYQGDELEIYLNAQYISDVLNAIGSSDVQFHMASHLKSLVIKSPTQEALQYIVMPMKL